MKPGVSFYVYLSYPVTCLVKNEISTRKYIPNSTQFLMPHDLHQHLFILNKFNCDCESGHRNIFTCLRLTIKNKPQLIIVISFSTSQLIIILVIIIIIIIILVPILNSWSPKYWKPLTTARE